MIMAKKYQGYYDEMISSLLSGADPAVVETTHYQTDHCKVGGLLIRKWNLPQSFVEPILFHHSLNFDICSDILHTKLLALLQLAEHIIAIQTSCGFLDNIYNHPIRSNDRLKELLSFVNLDHKTYKEIVVTCSDLLPVL